MIAAKPDRRFPAALVGRRNVGVSLILDFAWNAYSANCLSF